MTYHPFQFCPTEVWDVESWQWPGINLLHPDAADALIQYRLARIPGAMEKAASYSPPFSGAMC